MHVLSILREKKMVLEIITLILLVRLLFSMLMRWFLTEMLFFSPYFICLPKTNRSSYIGTC